jgi:hypothetical protein
MLAIGLVAAVLTGLAAERSPAATTTSD